MKKYIILYVLSFLVNQLTAQEKLNLRKGQTLEYLVTAGARTMPMSFHLDEITDSSLIVTWYLENLSGGFIIGKGSLDAAANGYYESPVDNAIIEIPASQNLLLFSRSSFKSLLENKKIVFDGSIVMLKHYKKANGFILNGKLIDALYLEGESGVKIWLLNNPYVPLIVKIENNPFRVDATLQGIKNDIKF